MVPCQGVKEIGVREAGGQERGERESASKQQCSRGGAEGLQQGGGGLWPAARRPSACFLFLWRPPNVQHVVAPAATEQAERWRSGQEGQGESASWQELLM